MFCFGPRFHTCLLGYLLTDEENSALDELVVNRLTEEVEIGVHWLHYIHSI